MNLRRRLVSRLCIGLALFAGVSVVSGGTATAAQSEEVATTNRDIQTRDIQSRDIENLDITNGKGGKPAGRSIASVRIPAIGVKSPLMYGIGDSALTKGLGLWPGTGRIGQPGNAVIAGHRTSHTRPLYDINKLKKGDAIIFTTAQGVAEYRVTRTRIVKPNDMWITRPTKASTITLFACHPPHSIAYRWVVFAKLHSMTPRKAAKLSQ